MNSNYRNEATTKEIPVKRLMKRLPLLLLPVAMVTAIVGTPAVAAPTQTEVRLVAPVITADNSFRNYDDPGYWVSQGWFPEGITYRHMYAPIGSTLNLTWLVTDPATKQPLPDTEVTLRVNKGYSVSNAKVTANGSGPTTGVERTGIDQLRVKAKSDQFGFVVFQLVSVDDIKDGAEPEPAKFNQQAKSAAQNPLGDPNIALFSQVKPEILGEKDDQVDFIDFHFYKPNSTPTPDLSAVTVKALAPTFTSENSSTKDGVLQKYATAGSTFVAAFIVKDAKGAPVANRDVQIVINKSGSGANAKVTTGTAAAASAETTWSGKTDAYGVVAVNLKNGDSSGEPKPAALNAAPPTSGAVFARLTPVVPGATAATVDTVDFHFVGAPAAPKPTTPTKPTTPKKVTITCKKGNLTKKVTAVAPKCPTGYRKVG